MKKKKWILKKISIIAIASAPIVNLVSCGINPRSDKGYTFGLAIEPISSLNYIKYKYAAEAAAPLVEGLFKGGPKPDSPIYNYLNLSSPFFNGFNLADYSYQSGTLRRGKKGDLPKNKAISQNENIQGKYSINLNGKSKWANGDLLKASDFIDGLIYILDINSGSQRLKEILELRIKGVREFVDAQNEYAKIFGETYKNPFGYVYKEVPKNASDKLKRVWTYYQQDTKTGFPLRNKTHIKANQEQKYIDKIKKAATNIGLYGDKFSSHPHNKNKLGWSKDLQNEFKEDEEYLIKHNNEVVQPFKIDIESEINVPSFSFIINGLALFSKKFLPINKRFVESIGGIEKFGISKENFLTQGPFKIKSAILGLNGNMILEKDHSYWEKDKTIPEKIKLFFQSDPVLTGSLFNDGYISSSKIDSIYTKKMFSKKQLRNLIKKEGGYGMTGLIINLDKNTGKNKFLKDPIFRKALLLAIDRKEIIKISGFDSTLPSYSLLEPTSPINAYLASSSGVSIGNSFASSRIWYSDNYSAPIVSSSSLSSMSTNQLFTNSDQNDRLRNVELARKLMNQYFDENKIKGKAKITFLNDSTPFMQNMSLALKSQINTVFGDKVELEIKGLPKSLYENFVNSGNFEITWKNLDYLTGNSMGLGMEGFMSGDGIDKETMKTTGFSSNPAGSWTLNDAFKYYANKGIEEKTRKRLRISKNIWNKLKELTEEIKIPNMTDAEINTLKIKRINAFFNAGEMKKEELPNELKNNKEWLKNNKKWLEVDPDFDTNHELLTVTMAANKILMDQAVVIPTFRVDVSINIDRFPNVNYRRGQLGYGYLYDLLRKPKKDLPGLEVKGG